MSGPSSSYPASSGAPSAPSAGAPTSDRPRMSDPSKSVWCGNIDPLARNNEDDLKMHFKKYFPVRVDCKGPYAFIEFEESVDAEDALRLMDGSMMGDRRLSVRPVGPSRRTLLMEAGRLDPRGGPRDPLSDGVPQFGFRIEIEGVPEKTSWQDLKDFGRQAAEAIKYADVHHTTDKGKCGVISFAVKEDADRAVDILNGRAIDGQTVSVFADRGTFPTRPFRRRGGFHAGFNGGDRHAAGDRYGGGDDDRYGGNDYSGRGGYRGGFSGRGGSSRGSYQDGAGGASYDAGYRSGYSNSSYAADAPRERRRSPTPQRERRERSRSRSPRDRPVRTAEVTRDQPREYTRDARDSYARDVPRSDVREPVRDPYGQRDMRDSRDLRDAPRGDYGRDPRDSRDARDPRDSSARWDTRVSDGGRDLPLPPAPYQSSSRAADPRDYAQQREYNPPAATYRERSPPRTTRDYEDERRRRSPPRQAQTNGAAWDSQRR